MADPWSVSVTYQLFAPNDADTGSWDESDARLYLFDDDPSAIEVATGSDHVEETLRFVAPEVHGNSLRPGYYGRAQPIGSADPTRPQMETEYFPPDPSCRQVGSFDVRELHRTEGEIDRLWITFEQRCRGMAGPTYFGDVRIGVPERSYAATPSAVTWPDQTFAGARGSVIDVVIRPMTSPALRIERVSVAGPGRRHFEVATDGCSGASPDLANCVVQAVFVPKAPGPWRAHLNVEADGGELRVPLEGWAIPDESVWQLEFDASHPMGSGYPTEPSTLRIGSDELMMWGEGSARHVWFTSYGLHRDDNVIFGAPTGENFVAGTTYAYHEPGYTPGDGGLDLYLDHVDDCNAAHGTFTVHDWAVGTNDVLRRAGVSFTHICDDTPGADGTLVGDVRYRWAPDLAAPGNVTALNMTRVGSGRVVGAFRLPADDDLAGAEVRWYPSGGRAAMRPSAGQHARLISASGFRLPARSRHSSVTVAVFAYDEAGNFSEPTIARLPGPGR